MKDSLFGFKDDKEREEFIIAIPVVLLFAWLVYYLLGDDIPTPIATTAVAGTADLDGDGVTDDIDQCTVTAGTIANFGCPAKVSAAQLDSDADGIVNSHDNCPNTRGTIANNGCAAVKTAVASETQSLKAAPDLGAIDTDADGVNDLSDQCPTLAGSIENAGCPVDTDGDTIADAEDRCPSIAGGATNLGCPPDADKDGVFDSSDSCPQIAGSEANNGCPADTDADGVIDTEDQCPELAGSSSNGCPPDRDGDTVTDAADLCPDEPGTPESNGCPAIVTETEAEPVAVVTEPEVTNPVVTNEVVETDTDGDGVIDTDDLCPSRAGEVRLRGCPLDTDADGVADADDQCPNTQGPISNNGCPQDTEQDADGDGIADAVDSCPSIAGVAPSGCPLDTDGDGVADADDQCPDEAGTIPLRGCLQDPDADATTISAADQLILDEAVKQVAFNSSSATLTPRSRGILRDIAGLMKKYPAAILEVKGHTDSSGNASRNMELSMQRARACAAFIASEGVALERLFAYGFGESQPITDNATNEGRRLNRRVEFELKF